MRMSGLKIGNIAIITGCTNNDRISKEYMGTVIAICQKDGSKELRAQIMGPTGGVDHSWTPLPEGIQVIDITDEIIELAKGVMNATE